MPGGFFHNTPAPRKPAKTKAAEQMFGRLLLPALGSEAESERERHVMPFELGTI